MGSIDKKTGGRNLMTLSLYCTSEPEDKTPTSRSKREDINITFQHHKTWKRRNFFYFCYHVFSPNNTRGFQSKSLLLYFLHIIHEKIFPRVSQRISKKIEQMFLTVHKGPRRIGGRKKKQSSQISCCST
jgi:hypothetical protein